MGFLHSDKAKMLAGKALLFPVNNPKTTLALIGAAVLVKALSGVSGMVGAGANIYSASQQGDQTDLLRKLVDHNNPPPITPINSSQLLGG